MDLTAATDTISDGVVIALVLEVLCEQVEGGVGIALQLLATILASYVLSNPYPLALCTAWLVPKRRIS